MTLLPGFGRARSLHRTGGAALITLILADLLDLATSSTMLLTDPEPVDPGRGEAIARPLDQSGDP